MEITKQTTPFFQTSCKYLSVFFLASYINYTYAEKETIAVTVEAPKGSYADKKETLDFGKIENGYDSFAFGRESSVIGFRSYALGAESKVNGRYSNAIGHNSTVVGDTSNAIGWRSNIKGSYSNALGRATNIESNYSLALGEAAEAKGGDEIVSIGDYASATGHSTVAIGGYSKIEPLKNGENLVGGKKKVIYDSSTKKISVSSPDLSEEDIIQAYGETYGAMALGYKSSSHSLLATAIGSHATAAGTLSTTTGTNSEALGYHATAYGAHSKVTGDNAGAFGVSTEASGKQSLALGYDSEATAENSVALGAKSVANKENTVSVGSDTLKRKIINVADGTEDYDAVNVRQLNAVEAKIGGIGNQFTNINNHLDRVDTRMNRVGASAAALASLKHANLGVDDKFAVSVGVGNYKNTQAMAVGAVFKPSENVLLNLSGSMSGSEKMLGAGVSWKFGNKSKPTVSTQSAVNSAEVLQLRQEMLAMQKELAELKKALRK